MNNPILQQSMVMDISSRSNSPVNLPIQLNAEQTERLKKLYPYADIDLLPKQWSSKDKANFITLSDDGLQVHYKGSGKTHKDAASVRASNSIPQSCLLFYYEVKIISKGRDGYMGIGLAASNVHMHRLPGWDKQSYGYHGDDGHSFNSSGTGQPYGPTFTTGDVIGCGYNIVDNVCFYTKNGLNLGVAFFDLPNVPLFPTVGLQTPGEEIEANFGLKPFVYDIEQEFLKVKQRVTTKIDRWPVNHTEWQPMLHKLVQSWLIHNGYFSTVQVFSEYTKIPLVESIQNMKQRFKIQQLVLNGKIGEAIKITNRLYPTLLQNDVNLLFALKCRQFIEFVLGNDDNLSYSANGSDCNGNSDIRMELDDDDTNNVNNNQDNFNESTNIIHDKTTKRWLTMLRFGKELNELSKKLTDPEDETNVKMLHEAWYTVVFSDPKEAISYMNYLDRETVSEKLNNAIVSLNTGTEKVAIETVIKHTKALLASNNYCGAWIFD